MDPENVEAKLLKAHSLRVIGYRMLSADARHWALTSALELEGKITINPNDFFQTSPEQLAELPVGKLLKLLPTRLNPEEVQGWDEGLDISITDTCEEYFLHIRNNILTIADGLQDPRYAITLDSDTYKKIITKQLPLRDAIDSGLVDFYGNSKFIHKFLSVFDPLTITADSSSG